MLRQISKVLFATMVLSSVGCGNGGNNSPASRPGSVGQDSKSKSAFSYQYIMCVTCADRDGNCYEKQSQCYGGCTTGNHTYSNRTDACNGLTDGRKNNYCASEDRWQMAEELGCN